MMFDVSAFDKKTIEEESNDWLVSSYISKFFYSPIKVTNWSKSSNVTQLVAYNKSFE